MLGGRLPPEKSPKPSNSRRLFIGSLTVGIVYPRSSPGMDSSSSGFGTKTQSLSAANLRSAPWPRDLELKPTTNPDLTGRLSGLSVGNTAGREMTVFLTV